MGQHAQQAAFNLNRNVLACLRLQQQRHHAAVRHLNIKWRMHAGISKHNKSHHAPPCTCARVTAANASTPRAINLPSRTSCSSKKAITAFRFDAHIGRQLLAPAQADAAIGIICWPHGAAEKDAQHRPASRRCCCHRRSAHAHAETAVCHVQWRRLRSCPQHHLVSDATGQGSAV